MNLTIKSKILFGLFSIIFLFILASYLATLRIDSIKNHILAVNSLYIPTSKVIAELKSIDEDRGLRDTTSFETQDYEDTFHHFSRFLAPTDGLHLIKSLEDLVKSYNLKLKTSSTTDIEVRLLKTKIALNNYNIFLKNALTHLRKEKLTLEKTIKQFVEYQTIYNKSVDELERAISRKMQLGLLKAERDGKDIIISLTTFMIIMTIVSFFIFFMTSSSLKPLEDLYQGVKRLSESDFNYKIILKKTLFTRFIEKFFPFLRSKGEIEALAFQFNQMAKSILTHTKELRRTERLATIGKISSEITHEIRNPLNAIGLNLSLLEDELKENNDAKILFSSISEDISRLSEVTRNYLNFIKPVTVAFTKESLNEIIWSVYDTFKRELDSKNINFKINIPSVDIVLPLDKKLFTQVLINLIKNAIEACSELPLAFPKKITLTLSKINNNYYISLTDNGPGVNASDLDKIFLPFFTRKPTGSGLGLGISYEIIKKHNGELTCSSYTTNDKQEEKETTFTITLPSNTKEL